MVIFLVCFVIPASINSTIFGIQRNIRSFAALAIPPFK
ncbi:hypothetical protein DCCM_3884 [Desulfocucumis palustris]|uniref:Uncharacterized protein n=1 Tax=Desulfocucumis palustris TaxID=1898651 RepID=A0A2L2XFG9_9FIRM|nr:hypothetical protein DCCM_3884 [Desulfocucumis palustris]